MLHNFLFNGIVFCLSVSLPSLDSSTIGCLYDSFQLPEGHREAPIAHLIVGLREQRYIENVGKKLQPFSWTRKFAQNNMSKDTRLRREHKRSSAVYSFAA